MQRFLSPIFAAVFAFGSVVEFAHFRRMMRLKDWRAVTTLTAAVAAGYIASECLDGDWPSWRHHGYED